MYVNTSLFNDNVLRDSPIISSNELVPLSLRGTY